MKFLRLATFKGSESEVNTVFGTSFCFVGAGTGECKLSGAAVGEWIGLCVCGCAGVHGLGGVCSVDQT